MIRWVEPARLVALLVVPLVAAFLVAAARRRRAALARFVAADLVRAVAPDVDPRRRTIRGTLLCAALLFLVLALAGPEWGFRWQQVHREGVDLVIALDTSRSMLATDVKPNRLARAKLAVRDLLDELEGDRVALVAFAGTAFLQCPLTLDYGVFTQSLDALDAGIIPRGGTNLAAAIDTALQAFEGRQGNNQALVIITDGESHEGALDDAIALAKERGVKIYTVGIGTPEGELIPLEQGGFVKDRAGQVVKSRLDEATLERIAVETGGAFLRPTGASIGLTELYRDYIARLEKRELTTTLERRWERRFQIPLALAFLLLLAEALVGERRRAPRGRTARAPAATAPGASDRRAAVRAAAALLALFSFGFLDPDQAVRDANRLYDEGKYDEAQQRYQQSLVDRPDSPLLHFNLGDAAYKQEKWDEAAHAFDQAAAHDPKRAAAAAYNLGNTRYRRGQALEEKEPQKALEEWGQALAAYRRAMVADPSDPDAKFNHEWVEKKAAELKKKIEEQQRQQQDQQKQEPQDQADDQQQQQQQQPQEGEPNPEQQQQPEQAQDAQEPKEQEQQEGEPQQAQQEPKPGEEGAEPQEQQAGEQPAEPEKEQQEASQASERERPAEASEATAADGKQMTEREARALLDAQRDQELKPEDMIRRKEGARVRDAVRDW